MRHWSEKVAGDYLLSKGYTCLAENYTVRVAELDLVMQEDEVAVFVEVKQRKTSRYGMAAAISAAKLQRMRMVVLHYLVKMYVRDDLPVRFDAVLLDGTKASYQLEPLENIYL